VGRLAGEACVSAYNPQRNPLGKSFYPSHFWSLTQWAKDPTYGSHSGSSAGSAVAVSAGFASAALGTETLGSLCAPADAAVRLREIVKAICYRLTQYNGPQGPFYLKPTCGYSSIYLGVIYQKRLICRKLFA
jgi:hypothetical protein